MWYNKCGDLMNILLIEDNLNIVKGLEYAFSINGYELKNKTTIKSAREYLNTNPKIDLIILDVTLSDGNGINFLDEIKHIPTIFLTADDEEDDIVKCLNNGAEDYITKPFSTKELLARVNKILLRNKNKSIIKVRDIYFDMDKMIVKKDDKIIELTPLELKLLQILFLNLNKVVSRNTILDTILENTGNYVDDHTVTVYFNRLREKLDTDIIITIKKIGYRIDEK